MHRFFDKRKSVIGVLLLFGFLICLFTPSSILAQTPSSAVGSAAAAAASVLTGGGAQSLGPTTPVVNALQGELAGIISWFLGIVVNFLGKVILLLVNILMGFLMYNDFMHAAPVELGWRILRDLANMFFIVILLVCAFSTIVGYNADLHVRKVLPKLLFTAVTINFSKTFVGLMIDASQVVMLAFVNAFQAVGIGNFVNALHLQEISSIAPPAAGAASNIVLDVILSYLLATMMLILTIGIVTIMIIFIVARIVGLWMALIFAPLAFLMGALPGKLSANVGKLSSDYWPKLNGLLFGGPIMAFFLWLTFATVSSMQGDQNLNLFQPTSTGASGGGGSVFNFVDSGATSFLTTIGNTRNLASYIVAVSMMLLGLDAAMDAMSKVGGIAQEWASSVNKKARGYAQKVAASPWTVTKGAAGFVDRRADISGRAAALVRAVPLVDRFAGDKLKQIQFKRRQEWAQREKDVMSDYQSSTRSWERGLLKGRMGFLAKTSPVFGNQGDELGYAAILQKEGSVEAYNKSAKQQAKAVEDQLMAVPGAQASVARGIAAQQGNGSALAERLGKLSQAQKVLHPERDKEQYDKLEDEIKKIKKENPALLTGNDRTNAMAGVENNLSNLSDEQTSDLEVLYHATTKDRREKAFFDAATGTYRIKDANRANDVLAEHKGKPTEKKMKAFIEYLKNNPNGVTMQQLRDSSMQRGTNGEYGVYNRSNGLKTITQNQQRAEQALQEHVKKAPYGHEGNPGHEILPTDPAHPTDLSTAGNAFLAAIPHIGITEALNRTHDADDQAGRRTIEEQFKLSGTEINTYAPTYDEGQDPIKIFGKSTSSDQEKFKARTEFQKDFQRVEAIMSDVPNVEPSKRIEFMAMMDLHRADRFITAPSEMLEEGQKETAKNIKKMTQGMEPDVRSWRNSHADEAKRAALIEEDLPSVRKAKRIIDAVTAEARDFTPKEREYMKEITKDGGSLDRVRTQGLVTQDGFHIDINDKAIEAFATPALDEARRYHQADRFIQNAKKGKGSKRRGNR